MSDKKEKTKAPSIKDQLRAQRIINANVAGEDPNPKDLEVDEDEEEDEGGAASMTVAELKLALDDAEVEYDKNAKKADLVALFEEHGLGQ